MSASNYILVTLGAVTGTMPDGKHINRPITFGFIGEDDAFADKPPQYIAAINRMMEDNKKRFEKELEQMGANNIISYLKPLEAFMH